MNQILKPFPEAVAEIAREYRALCKQMRADGYKQEYIAACLGVSQTTVSDWLSGRRGVARTSRPGFRRIAA